MLAVPKPAPRVLAPALVALAAVALSAGASTGAQPSAVGPSARAFAVQITVPGGTGGVAASASAPQDTISVGGDFAFPGDGSVVRAGAVTAAAFTVPGDAVRASSSSQVGSLSLFGGEITASSVTARASAGASATTASGQVSVLRTNGLDLLGRSISGTGYFALGDWGYAVVGPRSGGKVGGTRVRGHRVSGTALVVHLNADHGGLPAGSEIAVGYVEATAQAAIPEQEAPPLRGIVAPETASDHDLHAKPRQGSKPAPLRPQIPPIVLRRAPEVAPKFTARGHVFPIYGPSSFTNTFAAARANVGWHHGEDIFAQLGSPVLAVADGTVFSVGWNRVGGFRLWLRDDAGNEFYYAHLSAFSTAARNGARVKAGTVVGFVGNTGDAETTPFHLHFEIHPAQYLHLGYDRSAIAPYPILLTWRILDDVPLAKVAGWAPAVRPSSSAPRPGAILLQASDISTASGLDPASLRRALESAAAVSGAHLAPLPSSEAGA